MRLCDENESRCAFDAGESLCRLKFTERLNLCGVDAVEQTDITRLVEPVSRCLCLYDDCDNVSAGRTAGRSQHTTTDGLPMPQGGVLNDELDSVGTVLAPPALPSFSNRGFVSAFVT
jgi:hypothetical protein